MFQAVAPAHRNLLPHPPTERGLDVLPFGSIKLCSLEVTENNPYHAAASALVQSLDVDGMYSVIMIFLSSINHMRPEYRRNTGAQRSLSISIIRFSIG